MKPGIGSCRVNCTPLVVAGRIFAGRNISMNVEITGMTPDQLSTAVLVSLFNHRHIPLSRTTNLQEALPTTMACLWPAVRWTLTLLRLRLSGSTRNACFRRLWKALPKAELHQILRLLSLTCIHRILVSQMVEVPLAEHYKGQSTLKPSAQITRGINQWAEIRSRVAMKADGKKQLRIRIMAQWAQKELRAEPINITGDDQSMWLNVIPALEMMFHKLL